MSAIMKSRIQIICILALSLLAAQQAVAQKVVSIKIDGAINPAVSEFIHNSLKYAEQENAECLIIQLNTPGGLLKSTRVIVSDILEAKIPVIVYVSPAGSQAASAGVFVTLAANLAVMAPGTNIGAAHPVSLEGQMDSVMTEKATNDAAAFIRSIAEKRKRNLLWAEEAVRNSISITETEALEEKVIDFVAKNLDEVLEKANNISVETSSGTVVLQTTNATIEQIEMSFSEKLLDILSDPNIAYILFMLGVYGLMFELYNPGSILPGVVGVISLILAFYSLHTLPVNYAGLALIIFAIILFLAEIKITSYGMLTVGGVISLILGSMMLIRSESGLEFIEISWSLIISSAALTLLFFMFVIGFGIKAQSRKPTTGKEGIVGETGEALTALNPTGKVRVHGEIWDAETMSGKIAKGERVRVVAMEHLKLRVEQTQ
ncbi:MAG: nodulation protein NfeD [Ignavibacteriae bacterium]|nr:nodulation protein NfeD [Ignavibacteriota bacterium]